MNEQPGRGETAATPDAGGTLEQYATLANAVDDGLYQLDADGNFVAVNDAVVERTGYAREELLGEHVSLLLDRADVARVRAEIQGLLADDPDGMATLELSVRAADGETIPCELRFSLLASDGELDGTVGVVRDRSRSAEREQELDRLRAHHESIVNDVLDEADVGVFVLDSDFTVAWTNEAIEEYFGLDRTGVVGQDKRRLVREEVRETVADSDAFAETVLATYDDNTYAERFECQVNAGDGREERWLEHRSKPIESGRYEGGRVELYYDITEQKAAEQALRESEQGFRSLVQAVEEYAIFMLDADGHVVSWNEGAERIKGYTEDEIRGQHISTFYTDADREANVPEQNLVAAAANGSVEDEGWRVRNDGTKFWANVTITGLFDDDGDLRGYAKVTRDMTERREHEQQLQHERDLVERLLEAAPASIVVIDSDGTSSRANEQAVRHLGIEETDGEYALDEADVYDEDGEYVPPGDRPYMRVFETGEQVTDWHCQIDHDEGRRWLSMNTVPLTTDGDVERVIVTAQDITQLKEQARQLERKREELESELTEVFDRVTDGFFALDEEWRFTHLNEQVETLLGRSEAELLGQHFTDEFSDVVDIASQKRQYEHAMETQEPVAFEEYYPAFDTWFEVRAYPSESGLSVYLRDVTERKEYERKLKESNERLEQFAYAASHDLQEPLRMVSSYLSLIERRYGDDLDADGEEFLEFAVDGADRMREMIDALLKYSRVETRGDPFETVDLDDVFEAVRQDLAMKIEETGAEVTAEALPRVEGDANQLRQVFQNLMDNAIEYSDEPPRVHVSAERCETRTASERSGTAGETDGPEWRIAVRDDGIGIDPDHHDRIFRVFEHLHVHDEHDGTGIGLALCQRIVERHGGDIWVESEPGEGSTFYFTIPAEGNDD